MNNSYKSIMALATVSVISSMAPSHALEPNEYHLLPKAPKNSPLVNTQSRTPSEFFSEDDVDVLLTLRGEQANDGFGWVAENLGDINGDGASDFIVTAPFFTTNLPFPAGKFYVYSGIDGSVLNSVASPGVAVWGYSAKSAGDVNADGVPDYVVGSFASVTVFSGANHSILQQWFKAGEFFGASVAGVGDLNQDGFDDIVIGARYASGRAENSGMLYAYSGQDGELLWQRSGRNAGDQLGTATGAVDDLNHDGVPDVVVGARGAGKNDVGRAYVLSGRNGKRLLRLKPTGEPGLVTDGVGVTAGTFGLFHAFGVGDVNGDNIADVYVGDYNAREADTDGTGRGYLYSGKNGKRLKVFEAENPGDGLGPARGVGDIDGDGYNDLFIAAYTFTGGSFAGKGYLYSGKTMRLIRTMTGTVNNQFLGVDALSVGDVNLDGITDFMLTGSGILHVISGASK